MSGPLSIATSTAKAAIPTLADGITGKFRLQQVSWVEPEGDRTYPQVKFDLRTTAPMATRDGDVVQAGFPVFDNVNLGTKDNPGEVPKMAITHICNILDGLLGTADQPNPKGKPVRPDFFDMSAAAQGRLEPNRQLIPTLIGKEVVATVKLAASKQNPDQVFCNLTRFTYPPEVAV